VTELNLNPKTQTVVAASIKPGHVILESHEHPAQVTRVTTTTTGRVTIYARYIWQASAEKDWKLGTFALRSPIQKAVR
jgi:hypothetical protein